MWKRPLYVVGVAGVLLLAACGGGSDSSSSTPEDTDPPSTVTSDPTENDDSDSDDSDSDDSENDDGDSDDTITIGEDTYALDVQNCVLPAATGTFAVTAFTTDGSHEFSAAGVAGTATITFRGVGVPDTWIAAGATPTVTDSSFEYSGTVAGGSGEETMDVSITC